MTSISRAAVGARTCTQPLSELATVSAGYVEVPEPISVRRRCIWGSWHLQTAHTSDHCDLWRCALLAQGQAADKLSTCKQHSRQKDTFSYSTTWPELLLGFCPTSRWCSLHSKAHHNVTKQHERSLPGDATARGRLPSNVPHCCKAAQKRRHYQACSDRNDSPPSWIPRKDAKRGAIHSESGNLQTKLSRCCGGAAHLCTGYAHRGSGWGQPNSPPESPELPCDRWARGATKQSAGPSQRGPALTEVSASMSEPRNRRRKSTPIFLRSHGL